MGGIFPDAEPGGTVIGGLGPGRQDTGWPELGVFSAMKDESLELLIVPNWDYNAS